MVIIVVYLLMGKKSKSLKLVIKMWIFQHSFVKETHLKSLTLRNLEKCHLKEIYKIFQWIIMLLIKSDIINILKYLMVKKNIK